MPGEPAESSTAEQDRDGNRRMSVGKMESGLNSDGITPHNRRVNWIRHLSQLSKGEKGARRYNAKKMTDNTKNIDNSNNRGQGTQNLCSETS